jgi:hypothetical protein
MRWAYIGLAVGVLGIIGRIALVAHERRRHRDAPPVDPETERRIDSAVQGP